MKYKHALFYFTILYSIISIYAKHINQKRAYIEPFRAGSKNEPKTLDFKKTVHLANKAARSKYNVKEAKPEDEVSYVEEGAPVTKDLLDGVSYEDEEFIAKESKLTAPVVSDVSVIGEKQFESSSCWMSLNAASIFKTLEDINNRYADGRKAVQQDVIATNFNEIMQESMLYSGGAAVREMYKNQDQRYLIPAGLNLGGYCMMKMPDSVLFFHRIKLRNDTRFRVNYIHNDLANMVLKARLSLNDLHLQGAFERSVIDRDPSVLFYAPTFGQVEFLLYDVEYMMEGRYRLIADRLMIEVLISEIKVSNILMTYINSTIENTPTKLQADNIAEFIDRMKTDLDKWLKDYFNDFLIYTELSELKQLDTLVKYDKDKAKALNKFMDESLNRIRKRLRNQKATVIKVPKFTIVGIDGFQINLHGGFFRGLDSIFRRSVATTNLDNGIRMVDAIVGFSNLKVTYRYDALIPTGLPPVSGTLTLSANEMSAHLSLAMVKDPETVNIDIDFLDQTKPESLTVEGSANILIANFKHILEHQIIALMSNALIYGIKTLRSLPKCEPFLPGQIISSNNTKQEPNKPPSPDDNESPENMELPEDLITVEDDKNRVIDSSEYNENEPPFGRSKKKNKVWKKKVPHLSKGKNNTKVKMRKRISNKTAV